MNIAEADQREAREREFMRHSQRVAAIFLALCAILAIYALLAVMGVVPAAPWSPLGKA